MTQAEVGAISEFDRLVVVDFRPLRPRRLMRRLHNAPIRLRSFGHRAHDGICLLLLAPVCLRATCPFFSPQTTHRRRLLTAADVIADSSRNGVKEGAMAETLWAPA